MAEAAEAAFNFVASQLGCTGFQGSYAALKAYKDIMRIEGPFGIVKANDALYPQYDLPKQVQNWIEDDWNPWLVEQARKNLAEHDPEFVHPNVHRHWRQLAAEGVTTSPDPID